MSILNSILNVFGFSPAASVAQPKSESYYASPPIIIDFPPANNGDIISIQHQRSLRTIEIEVFQESTLGFTTMINGNWEEFSKHEWERVS